MARHLQLLVFAVPLTLPPRSLCPPGLCCCCADDVVGRAYASTQPATQLAKHTAEYMAEQAGSEEEDD